jgi:anti-sigma-K factor RskA
MNLPADPDDIEHLAGEYVLGTLPAAARRAVERRLADDAVLRAAVESWEARLLPLTALVPPAEVADTLWQRIEQRITPPDRELAGGRAGRSAASGLAGWRARATAGWNSLWLWRGLTVAALAGMAALLVLPSAPEPAARYVVVLVAPGSPTPGWVVQASSASDLSLVPVAPTDVPQAKALQFWTKADAWPGPVSLGLVKPGEPARVPIDALPPLQPNQLFEITLEPENGSPIGRPTGPILYIGRAVRLTS